MFNVLGGGGGGGGDFVVGDGGGGGVVGGGVVLALSHGHGNKLIGGHKTGFNVPAVG